MLLIMMMMMTMMLAMMIKTYPVVSVLHQLPSNLRLASVFECVCVCIIILANTRQVLACKLPLSLYPTSGNAWFQACEGLQTVLSDFMPTI
jgi:hypothetical protein